MRCHHYPLTLGILGAALTLTGCSGETADPVASPPGTESTSAAESPSTPTSADPTPNSPRDYAAAALASYFKISETAQRSGKLKDLTPLSQVATGDAYFTMRQFVESYFVGPNADRLRGTIGHALIDTVTSDSGNVVITSCQDWTNARVVMVKTGKEVPFVDAQGEPRPERFVVEYGVTRVKARTWRVETVTEKWDHKC